MSSTETELGTYKKLRRLKTDAEALSRAVLLSKSAKQPLVRALSKAEEVRRARSLGRQQLAVVAGAELLERIEEYLSPGLPSDFPSETEHLLAGLSCAVSSALDLPEVGFEAIDALIDELERLLDALGRKPWMAWMRRARRHYTAGDQERVIELTRSLLPHINYTNGVREKLGCPACVLSSLVWFMGPEVDPEIAYETLRPVLENNERYPNEDPQYLAFLLRHNPTLSCHSVENCDMRYGRVLYFAGQTDQAHDYVMRTDPYRDAEMFLLPMVVRLEYAIATNDRDELETWVTELESRMLIHEDIDEAFQAALRVAQALERLELGPDSQPRIQAALDHAIACATRLDHRLVEPHYSNWLAQERESGPPF